LTDLSAKFNELQVQLGQRTDELNGLKLSQSQNETDVEFALEEQKVLVQELEAKLAVRTEENAELSKKLAASVLEASEQRW